METTAGQLAVNLALPEELQDHGRTLDKKAVSKLLLKVARSHPDKYADVVEALTGIGRRVVTDFGGYSFSVEHLLKAPAVKALQNKAKQEIEALDADRSLSHEQYRDKMLGVMRALHAKLPDLVYEEAKKSGNPLATQVLSGMKGKPANLNSLIGGDSLYVDNSGNVVPVPIFHSYSEGLLPAEVFAGAFGARKGIVDTKTAVAQAGYFGKQLAQVAHRLVANRMDREGQDGVRGMPADPADADNEGLFLAIDAGGYKKDTPLTAAMLSSLAKTNKRILVRSPILGHTPEGGVYAKDVGLREHGRLPDKFENVGMPAAQALSEPTTQGMLGSKHSGGVLGGARSVGGFAALNALIQSPERVKGGAAHAQLDGNVRDITEAPAGGSLIWIGDTSHYAPVGATFKVKVGDAVEAGDMLTDGLPNMGTVVKHKGVGEGRRYFAHAFRDFMRDSDMPSDLRNTQLLATGLINHVRMTDEYGDYAPDDVLPYHVVTQQWEPRKDAKELDAKKALGHYLEKPVLHYSVGTKVRPSVVKDLEEFGVGKVLAHEKPPPWEPEMQPAAYNLLHDTDPMVRMYGSSLQKGLLDAAQHGGVSDAGGTSFVPALARAFDFGRQGLTSSSKPWGKAANEEHVLTEKDAAHSKGCVMASVNSRDAAKILRFAASIPDSDLADDGRETYPHLTILYGFEEAPDEDWLREQTKFSCKIKGLRVFQADEKRPGSDVLVYEVESADAAEMNADLREEYGVPLKRPYLPHITVAYVKPGAAWKHMKSGPFQDGDSVALTELRYQFNGDGDIAACLKAAADGHSVLLVPDVKTKRKVKALRAKMSDADLAGPQPEIGVAIDTGDRLPAYHTGIAPKLVFGRLRIRPANKEHPGYDRMVYEISSPDLDDMFFSAPGDLELVVAHLNHRQGWKHMKSGLIAEGDSCVCSAMIIDGDRESLTVES